MKGSTLKTQTKDKSGIKGKKKILVIDDNLTNKAIIDDILKNNGYDVKYASDGPEGLCRSQYPGANPPWRGTTLLPPPCPNDGLRQ